MAVLDRRQVLRRSILLPLVFLASLALAGLTALGLATVAVDGLQGAAIEASVAADRALILDFVARELSPDDLVPGPSQPGPPFDGRLERLTSGTPGSIYQVSFCGVDGSVLLASGFWLGMCQSPPSVAAATRAATSRAVLNPDGLLLEYLPIIENGRVLAVAEIRRDGGPIEIAVSATRRNVLLLVSVAAMALAGLLYFIFRAAQRRLDRQTVELVDATRRDALTRVYNHGVVVGALASRLDALRTADGSVAIGLLDLDNFRLLNDVHGHAAGDAALVQVANVLSAELEPPTMVGRFGPDEFVVMAPAGTAADMQAAIARVRNRLSALSLQFGASERLPLTISAAIAEGPAHGRGAAELLAVAGVTLESAKASGGNVVEVARRAADELLTESRSSFDVLRGLVIAVDTKDRYTKRHSEDVARYAVFLAGRLGLSADEIRAVRVAGLLHDVGKIGIPDAILRKPAGLSQDEYEIVKQHVALGDLIVRDLPDLDAVRAGIRHHHERWDGRGYLDRLTGAEIPFVARLLAVGDAFSAMTTSRPYRKALSVNEALRRLGDAAGSQLDESLVRAFIDGIETAADAPLPGDGRPLAAIWTMDSTMESGVA